MLRKMYYDTKMGLAERKELRKYKPKKRKKSQVEKATYEYYGVPHSSKREQQRRVDEAVREWKKQKKAEESYLRQQSKAEERKKKLAGKKRKRTFRKVWRRLI